MLEDLIARVAPGWALSRARSRMALDMARKVQMRYDATTGGRRGQSWRPVATDADAASAQRQRLAEIARDMVRNTPFAARAQQVIANNVVGDGIIPKISADNDRTAAELREIVEDHLDTTAIDAAGRNNLYGLQRLATNTVVDAGEVLVRKRRRRMTDGLVLPMQIEVLEPDYLDDTLQGTTKAGNQVRDGIEYDRIGRRVAYYLFDEHPGSQGWRVRLESRRVDARDVVHVFRSDRPGQNRGVSWFAPVALRMQDAADHQDAQLMRQKIAACFAAFRVTPDGEPAPASTDATTTGSRFTTLEPGRIEDLQPGEDIRFAAPPGVEGYDEFTRHVMREVAAGMGITYEALTGDLSGVNFSSARMGRMEMDRNVSSWQWTMLIPQMMQPLARWVLDEYAFTRARPVEGVRIGWVPPARILVDPAREIPPLIKKVRAGFDSRSHVIRSLGFDPERVEEEIAGENRRADDAGLVFDSDARRATASGSLHATPAGEEDETDDGAKETDEERDNE